MTRAAGELVLRKRIRLGSGLGLLSVGDLLDVPLESRDALVLARKLVRSASFEVVDAPARHGHHPLIRTFSLIRPGRWGPGTPSDKDERRRRPLMQLARYMRAAST